MDFQAYHRRSREFVKLARKGSNIAHNLVKDTLGEPRESFSWFTPTYVDQ